MNPFDPKADYSVPKPESKYLKFEEGAVEFMPLQGAVIGWEYWSTDDKPVRLTVPPEVPAEQLPNIRADKYGNYRVNHFWAFPVIDVATGKVKVLEVTQNSVQLAIRKYIENPRWGSPVMKYTLTVERDDSGSITKYTVMANPLAELPAEWVAEWERVKQAGFNINALFTNDDPFDPEGNVPEAPQTGAEMSEDEAREEFEEDTAVPPDHEEVEIK